MSRVKFTIDVDMEERWVDDFCSFLRYIQFCGDVGHSCITGFYADGDGDFKANFDIHKDFTVTDGEVNTLSGVRLDNTKNLIQTSRGTTLPYLSSFDVERVFDAG